MKKSLFKGTLVMSALLSAMVLAGCGGETESESSSVENISISSVIPGTVAPEAEPVTETVFKATVENEIKEEIKGLVTSGFKAYVSTGKRAAVTSTALSEAFNKIPESFKMTEDETSGSVKGSWSAPTGPLDFGEDAPKGLSARLDAMRFNLNASYKMTGTEEVPVAIGTANGSARLAGSAEFDFTDNTDSVIKSGKLNVLFTAGLSNVSAKVSGENLALLMGETSEEPLTQIVANPEPSYTYEEDDDDFDPVALIGALDSISGTVSNYDGINAAIYFEAKDDSGKVYNGILKIDITVDIYYKLSKENLTALADVITAFINETDVDENIAKLDELAGVSADISVYDVSGEKVFTYFSAEKLSDFYKAIKVYIPEDEE